MKFGTVAHDGGTRAAALTADGWRALPAPGTESPSADGNRYAVDLSAFLAGGGTLGPDTLLGEALDGAEPLAPLPRPAKVICCGLNYGEHIRETGRELPSHPTLFVKYADSLVGPTDDVSLQAGTDVDWEAELAVVVGATIRGADRATAAAAIAGYTVANDVSVRDWQYRTLQWFQGKAWDDSTPTGPVVVTPDEVDPTAGLDGHLPRQRRRGPARQHRHPRLRLGGPARLHLHLHHPAPRRPRPHRHAGRGGRGPRSRSGSSRTAMSLRDRDRGDRPAAQHDPPHLTSHPTSRRPDHPPDRPTT